MKERELPYKPKWGGPTAANTSPKYRIRVLQIQKHQPVTSCEWLCRRVMVLVRAVTTIVLWIGWWYWICLLADWCRSQNCSSFLHYLFTTTPSCPLYQPSKADKKWGETQTKGSHSIGQPEAYKALSNRENGNRLVWNVSLPHWNIWRGRNRKKTRELVMVKEGDKERKQARRSSKLRAIGKKSCQ